MAEHHRNKHNIRFQDLTGKRFGRWVVVSYGGHIAPVTFWNCRCDCGAERRVRAGMLKNKMSQSCGCLKREKLSDSKTTHGFSRPTAPIPEYDVWRKMIRRCYNPKNVGYANYGGRCISVCERWRETFANFLADMGSRPSPKHTLERTNNDGNYEPGNCRWATRKEQAMNRRNNVHFTIDGITKCLSEWAEQNGKLSSTVYYRMQQGMDIKSALTKPSQRPRPMKARG